METNNKLQLWRVVIIHRNGYEAPSRLVEAKTRKDAHKQVRELNLRLLDFPEKWSYQIIALDKEFDKERGKWI